MKPILFLDIDGVLNAVPPIRDVEVIRIEGFLICIPPGTKERVAKLTEVFEPVWATTWRGNAHPGFGEILELGERWDHLEFNGYKLPAIVTYAVKEKRLGSIAHPWVWIDDDAEWEMKRIGIKPDGMYSLAITPKSEEGLTDLHVEQALAFAERLTEDAWDWEF